MWLIGYYLDRGILPEKILALEEDERLVYTALAKLNEEKRQRNLEIAVEKAISRSITGKGGG